MSFDSLPSRNLIESYDHRKTRRFYWEVSIPFKRETSWKVPRTAPRMPAIHPVLIPFKRETSWKGDSVRLIYQRSSTFRFPSNGKPLGKLQYADHRSRHVLVSIPFNRETSWKVKSVSTVNHLCVAFQFPSTGKPHGKITRSRRRLSITAFRFPSTGKPHGK